MMTQARARPLAWLAASLLLLATSASAQHLRLGGEAWQEDTPPPPPDFKASKLVDIEMPAASAIRMGIAADTIQPNRDTGIVRYVVVARGPSAVNATYEGIRCATGEYRVYARKVQDNPWSEETDSAWQSIRVSEGATTRYRWNLARDGMCDGPSVRGSAAQIIRELLSGNESLYR